MFGVVIQFWCIWAKVTFPCPFVVYMQEREVRIVAEERTRMTMTKESWCSKRMDKVCWLGVE